MSVGQPRAPTGLKQTVGWAAVRFHPGEDSAPGRFASRVNSLFFSPKKTAFASNGSWAVLYPDDAEPGLTTFTPIPPLSSGTLPFGYSPYQDPAVDIRAEGSTGIGEILVAFGVPGVSDPDLFTRLRIFHREGTSLVDRTVLTGESAPDFEGRTVYARVMSLSPFLLALGPIGGAVNRPPEATCRDTDRHAGSVPESVMDRLDTGFSRAVRFGPSLSN